MEAAQVDDYEPEFKYFPKLPLEIRTLIWELYQLSFIHVVYPHELVGLAWTLLSGGARKTVPGSHSPPGKYPSSFPFHRSIAAREPRFIHWKRRFDARLLACYESSQIAKRQLAAEEALGHRPRFVALQGEFNLIPLKVFHRPVRRCVISIPSSNYPYHFGSFDVDLIYFARSRGWSRYQSMKGKPQNASILFSFGSTFKYCPITRIAIRTSPAALDSLDIKPEDMTVHSNGKEATGDDISAKERLAAVFKEWKSARSLWIVVDLPVAPSWLDPSVPEQKKTRKKKNKINHTRRLRARLAGEMRCAGIDRMNGEKGFVPYDEAYLFAVKWFTEHGKVKEAEEVEMQEMKEQKSKVERVLKLLREVVGATGSGHVVEIRAAVDVSRDFSGV